MVMIKYLISIFLNVFQAKLQEKSLNNFDILVSWISDLFLNKYIYH